MIASKDTQVVYMKLKFFNNMKIFNPFERCNFDIINSEHQRSTICSRSYML